MLTSSPEKEKFPLSSETSTATGSTFKVNHADGGIVENRTAPQFVVRAENKEARLQAIQAFEAESATTEMEGPSRVPQLVCNAEVLVKHREQDLALVLLRQALVQDSFHVSTLRRIYGLLKTGEWTVVERTKIAHALCEATQLASDTLRLAKLEYEKGNLEMSLELYFEAAAQIQDEDRSVFEIYKDIGNIFVRTGDFDGAEEYYHKAFALDPDSDILHVNLGTLEIQRQDWGSARDRFRFALNLNASNDKAWVGLALSHYHLGDMELAFANLVKATDFSPSNRTAVLLMANWGLKLGRLNEAADALTNYLGEVSFDEDISLALIEVFCEQRAYDFASIELERVLLWNPLRVDLYELEAKIKGAA